MKSTLPFRHEDKEIFLSKMHPLIRLITPFLFVLPFLIIDDIYLIVTILLIILIMDIIFSLNLFKILSRFKVLIPFILLITLFIPFYVGKTIAYELEIGIKISVYREGLFLAILLFLRIFTALFVFLSFFSTLTYSEFIEALTKLRMPVVLIGSFIIMIHYIPILANSNNKILEAQEMRGKKVTSYWQKLKSHAFIMGKSIIGNMERSERLYESLKMRGFSGKITFAPRKIKFYDLGSLVVIIIILINLIYFIDLKSIFQGVFSLILP